MFSLDRFYNIIHNNLITVFPNGKSVYFYPFGTYDNQCVLDDKLESQTVSGSVYFKNTHWKQSFFHCYFFDQEPIYNYTSHTIDSSMLTNSYMTGPNHINILANSEKSTLKANLIKHNGYYDWYYFYHGFAALDWYRDFQYVKQTSFNRFNKVFICYNHLTAKYRSYRLHLVSNLIEQDLVQHGSVSLFHKDTWQDTIEDPTNPLDNRARVKIYKTLKNVPDNLTIDTDLPAGSMSATVNLDQLTSALFHVVTETIYFQDKLHLTEKIFKPIVAQRPFILVAAPGNLAYLKSYGFKTFDQWIDESYDLEPDHYVRIEKITAEIARLCAMPPDELLDMHKQMQQVLEHNYKHFYTTFKDLIIDELVDNFAGVLAQINNGRQPENHSRYHRRYELGDEYLLEVKKCLKK